jgi:hypothetical protein
VQLVITAIARQEYEKFGALVTDRDDERYSTRSESDAT